MFVNSQQISIDILLICEVITPHKIIIYTLCFYSILLSISFSQDHSKQAKPSTQNYFLLYNSRTRLHRGNIKQNSKLDHTKNFILLDQGITKKDRTKKNDKSKNKRCDGDTILGHLPQAWHKPRGVPIPMCLVVFLLRW